jgi:hypothetical protein
MQHHIAPDNQIERFGIAEGFNRHLAEQHVAEPLPCDPRLAEIKRRMDPAGALRALPLPLCHR